MQDLLADLRTIGASVLLQQKTCVFTGNDKVFHTDQFCYQANSGMSSVEITVETFLKDRSCTCTKVLRGDIDDTIIAATEAIALVPMYMRSVEKVDHFMSAADLLTRIYEDQENLSYLVFSTNTTQEIHERLSQTFKTQVKQLQNFLNVQRPNILMDVKNCSQQAKLVEEKLVVGQIVLKDNTPSVAKAVVHSCTLAQEQNQYLLKLPDYAVEYLETLKVCKVLSQGEAPKDKETLEKVATLWFKSPGVLGKADTLSQAAQVVFQ